MLVFNSQLKLNFWPSAPAARVAKLVGGFWHPIVERGETARKHLPITDIAAAGGWKDTETLLTCYLQADTQTLLAVMAEERKVHEQHIAEQQTGNQTGNARSAC